MSKCPCCDSTQFVYHFQVISGAIPFNSKVEVPDLRYVDVYSIRCLQCDYPLYYGANVAPTLRGWNEVAPKMRWKGGGLGFTQIEETKPTKIEDYSVDELLAALNKMKEGGQ